MNTADNMRRYRPLVIASVMIVLVVANGAVLAQPCGPGVIAPQCDGQCPAGQMCADTGLNCACVPATVACENPANPNGPPVCWGGCPQPSMVCATFAGGCMCLSGPILCGNGTLDPGEGCDDGNLANGDGCDANCSVTGCGNGIATAGEECDGADNAACPAGCQPSCTCSTGPLATAEIKCFKTIAKQGLQFVKGRLKLLQNCREQELKGGPGSCPAPDPLAIAALESKLQSGLTKACGFGSASLDNMGFPGQCPDPNLLDGFTNADLQDCILATHAAGADSLLAIEYDPTVSGAMLDAAAFGCQRVLALAGSKFLVTVLKRVQQCRNNILKGKLTGIPPSACATLDGKTATKIAKAASKLEGKIVGACSDASVMSLKACTPDQMTATAAAICITATHRNAADNPVVTDPIDLIDYEYAAQP